MQNDKLRQQGMTSLEAAALVLSNGETQDLCLAQTYDTAPQLDLDELSRSHLRRQMGFDFQVNIADDRLTVVSRQKPYVKASTKVLAGEMEHGTIVSEALISRLVEACMRLKRKWEKAK